MLRKSPVTFDPIPHKYWLNGKELQGITSVIKKMLFPDKYKEVPESVLKTAAAHGSMIHEMIEGYDRLGMESDEPQVQEYIRLRDANHLQPIANEYTVSDEENFASQIDIVYEGNHLADIKTTYECDKEYVSWQLSIYAYLFELQNPGEKAGALLMIWLPKNKPGRVIEVERKSTERVKQIMADYIKGVRPESAEEPEMPSIVEELLGRLYDVKQKKTSLEEEELRLKEELQVLMEERGAKKWGNDLAKVAYVPASTTSRVDTKRLQAEEPVLYEKYIKAVPTKATIRLTFN